MKCKPWWSDEIFSLVRMDAMDVDGEAAAQSPPSAELASPHEETEGEANPAAVPASIAATATNISSQNTVASSTVSEEEKKRREKEEVESLLGRPDSVMNPNLVDVLRRYLVLSH